MHFTCSHRQDMYNIVNQMYNVLTCIYLMYTSFNLCVYLHYNDRRVLLAVYKIFVDLFSLGKRGNEHYGVQRTFLDRYSRKYRLE